MMSTMFLVIWCAKLEGRGTVVVGWYKNATVYRYYEPIDLEWEDGQRDASSLTLRLERKIAFFSLRRAVTVLYGVYLGGERAVMALDRLMYGLRTKKIRMMLF